MPVSQPPYNGDHSRSSWEYELTSTLNTLEGRAEALLNTVDTIEKLNELAELIAEYNAIKERLETAQLYIQDEQPSPVYSDDFMWIQTNVNDQGDFSFWFCKGDE